MWLLLKKNDGDDGDDCEKIEFIVNENSINKIEKKSMYKYKSDFMKKDTVKDLKPKYKTVETEEFYFNIYYTFLDIFNN